MRRVDPRLSRVLSSLALCCFGFAAAAETSNTPAAPTHPLHKPKKHHAQHQAAQPPITRAPTKAQSDPPLTSDAAPISSDSPTHFSVGDVEVTTHGTFAVDVGGRLH